MNIIILICMHGNLSLEIIKTLELIIGKQKNIYPIIFIPGENTDILVNKYRKILNKLELKNKILFFTDMWGGTPFNAAKKVTENIKNKYEIICGTNIPMLLETLMCREEITSFKELIIKILENGKKNINNVIYNINNSKNINNNKIKKENINLKNKHMQIMLSRIDDRLIHGQVSIGWSKELKISRIIVINDIIANDPLRTKLLKQVAPPGITSHVVSIEKFIKVFNNPEYKNDKVLLLFNNPKDILKIIKKGIKITSVNIGGIAYKTGRKQITDAISLDKEEINIFYKLNKLNIELEVRKVPNEKKINLINLLNKIK